MLRARIIVAWMVLLSASAAAAATPEEVAKARTQVSEGRMHYNLGEFPAALKNYQEAYRLTQDPTLLFNIGQCQWKVGDDKAALHSYKAYLRNGSDPANRDQVEARIADLEKRIRAAEQAQAEHDRAARTEQPPATDAERARNAEDKAAIEKATSAAEKAAAAAQATAIAAEKTAEAARARPEPTPVPAATPAPVVLIGPAATAAPSTEGKPLHRRWWFWTAVGVVVVGAAAGFALAYFGRGEQGDCHGVAPCFVMGAN